MGVKIYELMLELGHKSQLLKRPLPNGYTHKWSIFVRGANHFKIEHCIERVVFQLHESFRSPLREITEPPYQVKETGYAGFVIPVYIYFKYKSDGPVKLDLDLMLLTDKPNSTSRLEKLKLKNPPRELEKCLVKSGAQLCVTKDKKERSDSPPAKKQKSFSLIPSKDMGKQVVSSQANNNNHSHSLLTSQLAPPTQSKHQSKSSHSKHHGNHTSQNHSNNNQNSNSLLGNQSSHSTNHQTTKQPSHQQSLLTKAKTSSAEMMDVFGAPLVYNNSKSQKTSKGKDQTSDSHRDVTFTATNSSSPIPPVVRQPSPQVTTSQTHNHSSRSHHHKSSHHHHHHHHHQKHNHHHKVKQEPVEALKTPPPPPPAQTITQKTSQKQPPQAYALTAQADPTKVLRSKIYSLTDNDRLQKIVDIIEESGEWFNLTPTNFEFDLNRLDKKTLSRIEKCLP